MKNISNLLYKKAVLFLLITGSMLPVALQAQKKEDKKVQVTNMVESQSYVFKAQTVLPSSGRSRQLNSDFDLRISKDTIASYLPYFGRAYTAPINSSEGPLTFTSTKFDYTISNRKKGGWDVVIMPKDLQDPRQMALSIFENGSASLSVTSNNRQPIAFTGYITAKNK